MPTVPRSVGPTVRSEGLGGNQLDSRMDTRGMDALAGAARQASDVVGQIYAEEKSKADDAAVLDARTKLSEWERNWFDPNNADGVLGARGKNARELPDRIIPDYEKKVAEIAGGLGNSDQQRAFAGLSLQFRESMESRVNSHVMRENEEYVAQTEAASLSSMAERAATAAREGRWDAMAGEVTLAHAQLEIIGQRKGMSQEAIDAQKQEFSSQSMVAATNGMLEAGDYAGAVAFYRDNADDMLESDRARMDSVVRNADLLVRETSEANTIMAKYGTGSAAVRAAEEIKDPVLRDRVVSNIDREAARQERAQNEAERAMYAQAVDSLFKADPATPVNEVLPPAVLARMDPKDVMDLQRLRDDRLARTETRTDPRVFEQLATLPPEELAKVNLDKEFTAGRLSLADTNALKVRQQDILNPDPSKVPRSATEAEILGQTFRMLAIPSGKNGEAKRGQFRSEYYQAERQAVKEKGRALTQDEQEVLANQLALRVSRTKPRWFWDSTETKSLYQIPEAERGEFTVPAAVRTQILADAKAQGFDNLTEAQVIEAYVRNAAVYAPLAGDE
jgi:hypothetical protein